MPKPYDATLKWLLEINPADWVRFLGRRAESAAVIDADVSAVSAASDKVIRAESGGDPWLTDINFQSGPDRKLPARVHLYSTLLSYQHELPVLSVVFLLHKKANLKAINGEYTLELPEGAAKKGEEAYEVFHYRVIRLWEVDPEELLNGGRALAPLAPLGAVEESEIGPLVKRTAERLLKEPDAAELASATYILMGLRYDEAICDQLLGEVRKMEESVTYQKILRQGQEKGREEGKLQQQKKTIRSLGSHRFGEVPAVADSILDAIDDLGRLEEMTDRILDVGSWEELLGLPPAGSSA